MKQIRISTKIDVNEFKEQTQFKFQLDQLVSCEVCMALLLLKEQLIGSVGLKFHNFLFILKLSKDNYCYFDSIEIKSKVFKGRISNAGLDSILHFILKYYRDGIAETEHIDVDFVNHNGIEYTLSINCTDYKEYSNEEIRRMLE